MSRVYFAAKGEKSKHKVTNEKNQRSRNEPWTSSCAFVTRRRNKFTPRRSHIGQYETPCRELTQCDLCAARETTWKWKGSSGGSCALKLGQYSVRSLLKAGLKYSNLVAVTQPNNCNRRWWNVFPSGGLCIRKCRQATCVISLRSLFKMLPVSHSVHYIAKWYWD